MGRRLLYLKEEYVKGYGNRDMQSAGQNALERVATGKKLDRARRRQYTRELMATTRMRGALGRAPRRTGQPRHFVEWRRVAAETRQVEQEKAFAVLAGRGFGKTNRGEVAE